jgi:IS5 family transposase
VKQAVIQKQHAVLRRMKQELDAMIPLVNLVLRQTTARVFRGVTDMPGKIVSVFEPTAEIIRKGKVRKPTEFGKLVKIQQAEIQIIVRYAVCRPAAGRLDLAAGSVRLHQQRLGRAPELLAGDAGFYSQENEREAHALGVQRVSIPNRSTHSPATQTPKETLVPLAAKTRAIMAGRKVERDQQCGYATDFCTAVR